MIAEMDEIDELLAQARLRLAQALHKPGANQ
jgi:hypothetical protein